MSWHSVTCLSVLNTSVSCVKTAEPIEMPFGQTLVSLVNYGPDLDPCGMGNLEEDMCRHIVKYYKYSNCDAV